MGYTAIGEQVGMAQRMESVAPPGGVMLSESTARLVEGAAVLGEPELVRIKGADEPVRARRLLGVAGRHAPGRACRVELWSVGAGRWPPSTACWSARSTATVRWSAWWDRRASARAGWSARPRRWRLAAVSRCFATFCESHASDIPFHVVARLLRAATGVSGLDGAGRPRAGAGAGPGCRPAGPAAAR